MFKAASPPTPNEKGSSTSTGPRAALFTSESQPLGHASLTVGTHTYSQKDRQGKDPTTEMSQTENPAEIYKPADNMVSNKKANNERHRRWKEQVTTHSGHSARGAHTHLARTQPWESPYLLTAVSQLL